VLRQFWVFMDIAYRDKKVVGVFCAFFAISSTYLKPDKLIVPIINF
jgi:hypothetical protein